MVCGPWPRGGQVGVACPTGGPAHAVTTASIRLDQVHRHGSGKQENGQQQSNEGEAIDGFLHGLFALPAGWLCPRH